MTLCLEEVRQVAVSVGRRDNYSVSLSSSECATGGEVCYLQLTCFSLILSITPTSPLYVSYLEQIAIVCNGIVTSHMAALSMNS